MDKTEEQRRWQTAEEHRQAAQRLYVEGLYRASVSRGYYACYQAMWVALGDPPLGAWRHGGTRSSFVEGGGLIQCSFPQVWLNFSGDCSRCTI
jgi:hypothetical protein